MPTLHVRSVPEDLYQQIQRLAEARSRSKTLASIRRRRFSAPKKAPSSLELLREDRKR